jgi:hypothetical protein
MTAMAVNGICANPTRQNVIERISGNHAQPPLVVVLVWILFTSASFCYVGNFLPKTNIACETSSVLSASP